MNSIISKVVSDLRISFSNSDSIISATGTQTDLTSSAGNPAEPIQLSDQDSVSTIAGPGTLLDAAGGDDAIVAERSADARGVDISTVGRFSALGRALDVSNSNPGFIINDRGASADINGQNVTANYFSLQANRANGTTSDLLSGTALDTTLKLGSVALNAEAIVATDGNDRFFGYREDAIVYGGEGNDFFRSLGGDKELYGEEGRDRFQIRGGDGAFIDGGAGTDTANFAREDAGLVIESIGRYGALGNELDLGRATPAYSVYQRGAEAEIDGETVRANYTTINTTFFHTKSCMIYFFCST